MMAAESLANVAWTAPSLIGGGFYLQQKLGPMATFKLFGLALFASYIATTVFGPATTHSKLNLRWLMPMRFDSIDTDRRRMVGADLMAGTCIYACIFANGLWPVGAAFAAFDIAYYGSMGVAMPTVAALSCLTLL